MAALRMLDFALRGAGAIFLTVSCYILWRLQKAIRNKCDSLTAESHMPPKAFAGKVVWITGASSGIGKELALQWVQQGAKVILSARRERVLNEVAAELKAFSANGSDVRVLPVDLDDLESLEAKTQEAIKCFGVVDILVNNGGYTSRALARETKDIDTDVKMMRVNFLSYVALTKSLIPFMCERKQGHIVNISSVAGKCGAPLRTLYCGAKHAIMGWFDAFRVEEAAFRSGIKVTNVCPGSIKTDVAINAVTADGGRRGYSDPNIEAGLDVAYTCDRILAAVHCGLDEVWIAKPMELSALYMNQYFPVQLKAAFKKNALRIVAGTMGDDFVKSRL